jgi:hypothetical protein
LCCINNGEGGGGGEQGRGELRGGVRMTHQTILELKYVRATSKQE